MSEATVYRKAVRQLNPELEIQIDNLLNKSRLETEVTLPHKISYSSDENMDTSDETVDIDNAKLLSQISFVEERTVANHQTQDDVMPSTSRGPIGNMIEQGKTPEEQAKQLIREAEIS